MLGCDAKHRGAHADAWVERHDPMVRHLFAKAIYQVNFRAHGPLRARRGLRDGFNDALGRAELVGGLRYFVAALRVRNYTNTWIRVANPLDVLWLKALMDGAVSLPQNHARLANRFPGIAPEVLIGIPNDHFVERDSHTKSGIAAEVLVRQKQDPFPT